MHIVDQQAFTWNTASWDEGQLAARHFVDGIGTPIDGGILDTVVALNLSGLESSASCEGHLDHGYPYPWVDFQTRGPLPDGIEEARAEAGRDDLSEAEKEAACDRFLALIAEYHHPEHLYIRLTELLNSYYAQTEAAYEDRLVVNILQLGWYRLMPAPRFRGEGDAAGLPRHKQAEMAHFTAYLKARWEQKQQNRRPLVTSDI